MRSVKQFKKHNPHNDPIPTAQRVYQCAMATGVKPEGADLALLAAHPHYAYSYAKWFLKGARFELGEVAIARRPGTAFSYAKHILRGPFELGEPAIACCSGLSRYYAVWCLKVSRFREGEHSIARNRVASERYSAVVIQAPFPAAGLVTPSETFGGWLNKLHWDRTNCTGTGQNDWADNS